MSPRHVSSRAAFLVALLLAPCSLFAIVAPATQGADLYQTFFDWLMSPLSGAAEHQLRTGTYLHGRLMVLAWGFFAPVAIVLARFYKVTPRQDWPRVQDNPFWFFTHRAVGWGACVLMIVAVACILIDEPWRVPWRSVHALVGWTVVITGLFQVVSSSARGTHGGPTHPETGMPLRRWNWSHVVRDPRYPTKPRIEWAGDHYNMSRTRVVFEYVHKGLGYMLLGVSAVGIISGLIKAEALNWMWIALLLWWGFLIGLFVLLQHQGRCIDTYQAIFGVEEHLPGNRRRPVFGWGVRRYTPETVIQAPWPRRRTSSFSEQ